MQKLPAMEFVFNKSYLSFLSWEQGKLKFCVGENWPGQQSTQILVTQINLLVFLFPSYPLSLSLPPSLFLPPFSLPYCLSYIFCMRSSQFLIHEPSLDYTGGHFQAVFPQLPRKSEKAINLSSDYKRKYKSTRVSKQDMGLLQSLSKCISFQVGLEPLVVRYYQQQPQSTEVLGRELHCTAVMSWTWDRAQQN